MSEAVSAGPRAAAGSLSIRTRLAVVGAATILLVVGLLAALVIRDLSAQRSSAVQRLLNLAEATAANVGTVIGTAATTAEGLAGRADRILDEAPTSCERWLDRGGQSLPLFTNLVLVDAHGAPVCSSNPGVVGEVEYGDRAWLRGAMEGRLTVDGPMMGRRFPVWSVAVAAPVLDAAGAPVGAVALGLDLGRLQDFMTSLSLPEGSLLTVARADGVIVARSRDPELWVGKGLPPPIDPERPLGRRGGLTEAPSLEGERMLFANVAVDGAPWRVYAGWSEREALGPAWRAARGSLGLALGLIVVTAVGLTWVYVPITRSLSGLVAGSQAALLERRTMEPEGPAEVRAVAARFNEAVGELTRHEDEARRLARVIAQLPDPVFITDRRGTIEYVNPAFERVTGYRAAEALGATPALLRSGEHGSEVYAELWRTITAGFTYRGRFRNRRKSGELYTEEKTIGPLRNDAGEITHFVSTGKDITEAELIADRLSQAEKLEAIGQMAGGVAHDFNNLLTAISGYAELLSSSIGGDAPEAEEHVRKILEGAAMGGALTRQLLGFTRRKVAQEEPVSLNEVVERLTAFLRRVIPADIEVVRRLDPAAGSVWLDPVHAEQVVLNLALNARDAMPDGGRLLISTSTEDGNGARWVCFEVSDTGLGIPDDVLPRVFDPFFTTKTHGTGLGLATVAEIVRKAGGSVDVRSAPREGTAFRIRLPEGRRLETSADPVERTHPRPTGGSPCTILLAEDDPQVRTLLTRILEQDGHRVMVATNGREALDRALAWGGSLDLVVTDVMMPEMKGPELVGALRDHQPGLPAVLISGYADVSLEAGFSSGPTELLTKPITPTALRAVVSRMAGARREG